VLSFPRNYAGKPRSGFFELSEMCGHLTLRLAPELLTCTQFAISCVVDRPPCNYFGQRRFLR